MKPRSNILQKVPILKFAFAFLLGIIIRDSFTIFPTVALVPILVFFLLSFFFYFLSEKALFYSKLYGISVLLFFICFGISYNHLYKSLFFNDKLPQKGIFTGLVLDESPTTHNRMKYTVKLDRVQREYSTRRVSEKILLYSSDSVANLKIDPGKRITFNGWINEISNSNNPGDFNYKRYMNIRGIRYQCNIKSGIEITGNNHINLHVTALNLRTKMLEKYAEAGITNDEFAVLGALTLGEKNFLSNDIKNSYVASGSMHILAVSGLHVGIIYFIINFLLIPLNRNKKLKIVKVSIIIVFLWIYGFITGLSPSVLRSCTMFSFIVVGANLNRRTNIYNTLATSAFVLMLINPTIIYEIGFQLSYLAVISIVFFQPKFSSLIKVDNKILNYLWGLITVSIAAQLGTTPVSLFYFHQFPSYFLLSNLLVVPLSGVILYIAFAFFCLSWIPLLSNILAFILKINVFLLNFSVQTIESIPGSVVQGLWISELTMILLYILIISLSALFLLKKGRYLVTSLSVLVILLGLNCVKIIDRQQQQIVIVYNNYSEPLISFIDGHYHYYYTKNEKLSDYSRRILTTVSGQFGTADPICIKENTGNKDLIQKDKYALFNKILLNFENISPQKERNKLFDLMIDWNKLTIKIDSLQKFNLHKIENGKLTSLKGIKSDKIHSLKNDGALLLAL
jgi:competence protein ComEC